MIKMSPIILWEAAKTVLRGKLIQLASTFKKARTAKCIKLENKVDVYVEKNMKKVKA